MKRLAFVYTCILIFSFCGKNVLAQGAAGLHNPVFGASALAQGNAFVARADDASAIQFNPAGLTQLQGPQVSQGVSFILPSVEYQNNSVSEDMDTNINIIPNIYFASPIIKNKLAAGLGITVPYGLNGKWDDDGFSRYVVTGFNLRIININPTITYKPLSCLSIGVGFDYYYANSSQESRIPFSLITSTPDGHSDLDMHGDGFGYNTGILYNITPHHSIGVSFRSKADINFDGKLKQSGFPVGVFGFDRFNSKATTSATIPEMLSFGYAYRHGDLWSIEADVQWTNWSRFDILNIGLEPPNPLRGAEVEDVRDWHNTWSFALGGEYALSEAIKVRGGYTFHESPVPSETLEPSIPQSSRHGLFTGLGYSWGKKLNKGIDFAYGAVFYENRNVNSSVGKPFGSTDGHYDIITHIMAINFNYIF
ncbi:MAG: OmpP1/FadL family transporter [Candidatus Brocadiaceae bacterium]|nr:OmpP1/FadL family transporter [Candidatus Brocadiaceae bacterium]